MKPLQGKNALITGGARRIGSVIARTLAGAGANVAIQYRSSADEAWALCEELERCGVVCRPFHADFEAPEGYQGLIDDVVEAAGKLDILVNNASIFPESTMSDMAWEDLLLSIRVNAWAPFSLSRAFYNRAAGGTIINILDTRITSLETKHVAYLLSKQMLYSLTKMMALEFAPRVRVNGVAPGLILPPEGKDRAYLEQLSLRTPMKRPGNPGDIAEAVLFLAAGEYITGQVLHVDGGWNLI